MHSCKNTSGPGGCLLILALKRARIGTPATPGPHKQAPTAAAAAPTSVSAAELTPAPAAQQLRASADHQCRRANCRPSVTAVLRTNRPRDSSRS